RPRSFSPTGGLRGGLGGAGLEAHVLTWTGARPTEGVQDAARRARYRLLAEWCASHNVRDLLVGHTMDDQAETVLQRLNRGSGTTGLSGMAAESWIAAGAGAPVRLLRPLLGVRRAALQATLDRFDQPYWSDRANEDERFERVRLRRALAAGSAGLSVEALARTARRALAAQEALSAAARPLVKPADAGLGVLALDGEGLARAPAEVARTAFRLAMAATTGGGYPPQSEAVDRALATLAGDGGAASLGGCLMSRRDGAIEVMREPAALTGRSGSPAPSPLAVSGDAPALWDRRFVVRATGISGATVEVGPVAETGLALLKEAGCEIGARRAAAWASAPMLYVDGAPAAQPQAGFVSPAAERAGVAFDALFVGAEQLERRLVRY
ncbi:MAG: tRNA lysidine(34) synthetase TilS, partial [Pseudomonadota bacterium]